MKYICNTTEFECGNSAVTLGKFDGVHMGHQKLIREIVNKKKKGMEAVVFTFDIPPGTVTFGNGIQQQVKQTLLTNTERKQKLFEMGVSTVIEYPVSKKLKEMDAEEFVRKVLCEKVHARFITVGNDFRFGYQRQGDVELLHKMAEEGLFEVKVIEKEADSGAVVSSTRIRRLLQDGNVEDVNRLLGYDYLVENIIIKGNQLGRTWGIPTINMEADERKLLPPNGVYFSTVKIENCKYYGITNIGNKPTIGDGYAKGIETYLYSCNKDLYHKIARVSLQHFHRPEKQFDSFNDLVNQLNMDIESGREYFGLEI